MSLLQKVKSDLASAMKSNDANAKGALRILLAKIQTSGQDSDEFIISTAKSLIKQNQDEIDMRNGKVRLEDGSFKEVSVNAEVQKPEIERLEVEKKIFSALLPQYLNEDQIREIVKNNFIEQIKSAKNAGAATGMAIKMLKSYGHIEGETVKKVVNEIFS